MDTMPDSFMMVFNTHKGLSYGLSYTGKTLFMKLEQEIELSEERLQDVNDFIENSTVGHWMGWSDILIVRVDDEERANMYDDDDDDTDRACIACPAIYTGGIKCPDCGEPGEPVACPQTRTILNAAMQFTRNTA